MKSKKILKIALIVACLFGAVVANVSPVLTGYVAAGGAEPEVKVEPDKPPTCASILTWMCDGNQADQNSIIDLILLVINIMTAGILVLATVGIVICGYTILTARDNEAQVSKARKRLVEVVIGLIAWVLGTLVLNLLLPTFTGTIDNPTSYKASSLVAANMEGEK